jgi:tyrosinase
MSAFDTAARDPIFWLHHANLDRFWEEWLALDGRSNPSAPDWRSERFELGKGDWLTSLAVHEVLDTTRQPLGYRYDRVETAEPLARAAATAGGPLRRPSVMGEETPELIGEAPGSVPLRGGEAHATVGIRRPVSASRSLEAEREPQRVYLRLENIRGTRLAAGSYEVHVSAEDGEAASDATKAGIVSLFGLRESSRSDENHPGSGLTVTLDVTDVTDRAMNRTGASLESLHVTFFPVTSLHDEPDPDVEVGGVKLFRA